MSYQSSIHFDPTTLLIIKNEISDSIKLVENAVTTLVEEQTIPFGFDDALTQLEQCVRVLTFLDMPYLAKITQHSVELMRSLMAKPNQVKAKDVIALSAGTTMLKRYIEFVCLKEVKVPQFLLDTLNQLEIALKQNPTPEGQYILSYVENFDAQFSLDEPPVVAASSYIHQLYKLSLYQILSNKTKILNDEPFKRIGLGLVDLARNTPSQTYWQLVSFALQHINTITLSQARRRILIQLESLIGQFVKAPDQFKPSQIELANVLILCISQENLLARQIRQALQISDDLLTDIELDVFNRQLYGPDYQTMHSVGQLLVETLTQARHDIEYNYQNMTPDKLSELQLKLKNVALIFKVLNLEQTFQDLAPQIELLSQPHIFDDAAFAQALIESLFAATNAIGILERTYLSNRLQIKVDNTHISLDRLDEAHQALLTESKILIDRIAQLISPDQQFEKNDVPSLDVLATYITELAGAALFLGSKLEHDALLQTAQFIQLCYEQQHTINNDESKHILNVLASLDMMIDNLKNNQPVLQSMFDVAFKDSQKLVIAA